MGLVVAEKYFSWMEVVYDCYIYDAPFKPELCMPLVVIHLFECLGFLMIDKILEVPGTEKCLAVLFLTVLFIT